MLNPTHPVHPWSCTIIWAHSSVRLHPQLHAYTTGEKTRQLTPNKCKVETFGYSLLRLLYCTRKSGKNRNRAYTLTVLSLMSGFAGF